MNGTYTLSQYGRIYNPSNWYHNPGHLTNRIYYIVKGTAYYQNDIKLKPGYIYIFRSSPNFSVHQDSDDPIDHVFFDFITTDIFRDREYSEINIKNNRRLIMLAELITEEFENRKCPWNVGLAYFNILIHELSSYLISKEEYSPLTNRMLHELYNCSPSEMSVSGISAALNINENHLIRTFKKDTGETPHKYINQIKANLAISYLQQDMTTEEISEKLGFSSVSSLCVFFKATTKRNLSYYRSQFQK